MDKLLEFGADTLKAVLPAAAEMAKQLLAAGGKLAGSVGKLCVNAVRSKTTKKALRKGRKLLMITAAVSGCIAILSCAGLILNRKK